MSLLSYFHVENFMLDLCALGLNYYGFCFWRAGKMESAHKHPFQYGFSMVYYYLPWDYFDIKLPTSVYKLLLPNFSPFLYVDRSKRFYTSCVCVCAYMHVSLTKADCISIDGWQNFPTWHSTNICILYCCIQVGRTLHQVPLIAQLAVNHMHTCVISLYHLQTLRFLVNVFASPVSF